MNYFYAIIERSFNFCVVSTGFGTHEKAWEKANGLQTKYPETMVDCDVLLFNTEAERVNYIREQTK